MNKGIFLSLGVLGLAATQAHALINLEFDQNSFTVTAPSSGTLNIAVTGQIDLSEGWTCQSLSLFSPENFGSGDILASNFDPALLSWFSGSQSTNYVGTLFNITVTPTSAGDYDYNSGSPSGLPEMDALGVSPSGDRQFADSEIYDVHVNPAPEPASMTLLGLGALALTRRRKN